MQRFGFRLGFVAPIIGLGVLTLTPQSLWAAPYQLESDPGRFSSEDVFQLEWASDPQISPDGRWIAYSRRAMDVMTDRARSDLWLIDVESGSQRPISQDGRSSSPRWSPNGDRLAYISADDHGSQLFVRWTDTGETARLTRLQASPGSVTWSPTGDRLAFSMRVPAGAESMVQLPSKPEGAQWAPEAKVIDDLIYRRDGGGYVEPGYSHLFILPAEGGTPRQMTSGDFDHFQAPAWAADGKSWIFSANRRQDARLEPSDSELFELDLESGELKAVTSRFGPDGSPVVSPDGSKIAYLGYDDQRLGYQQSQIHVLDWQSGDIAVLTADLDRGVDNPLWSADSKTLFFSYSDHGNGKVAKVDLNGKITVLTGDMGGTAIGRPYSGGSYSVSSGGQVAYSWGRPSAPADVALWHDGELKRLTDLNSDLLAAKELAPVEEIRFKSSFDGLDLQGWIAKPPGFDPNKKYPLILEIHGGPFADYGDRWSAEVQLFAAAGYVVFYMNPRGSSSYGAKFGNLIHHNYPGEDYDDLMSGIDAVLEQGYVDESELFVTGGSGGGVLTAWIVGKTDRFRAAASVKPVINWYSFVLTADSYNFFYKYWFPGLPWDHLEHYMKRSPLSLAGKVTTPTLLMTGEADYRTPISETEQLYQALKLRQVDTAMVRIPEASHGIAARPSHLITKVLHILAWFEKYRDDS